MHFLPDALEQYILDHSEKEPELLGELTRETHLKAVQPRMITGHYQGRVLSMFSKLLQPKRILEIGTYTGYSALCLAEGLPEDGVLHTIEINEELHSMQRKYFDRSPFGDQIIQHTGDALNIIPDLPGSFDLVFIDGKKTRYNDYFEAVLPKTREGGLILCDNVLWSGKTVSPGAPGDKATEELRKFNSARANDLRIESVILPIRDGLTLCRVL